MKTKSKLFRIISVTLIVALLTGLFPESIFASEDLTATTSATPVSQSKPEPSIVGEDVEKREHNVKHFLRDDMTYTAATYPFPVHYKNGDKWNDIDNTIINETDENGKDILSNKENDLKIKIAKSSDDSKLIRILKDNYEVAWGIENAKSAASEIITSDDNTNDLSENERKMALKKLVSDVSFKNVYDGVDFNYQIRPDSVKEYIVLNNKADIIPEFKFNLKVKNIIAQLLKDNTIVFSDDKDQSKKIFTIAAPYMYDKNGEQSKDIKVILEQVKDGYTLTLKPDSNWLASSERTYPVTIDPDVYTNQTINDVDDSYVDQYSPDSNYATSNLLVQKTTNSRDTYAFLKFVLPTLTAADMVTEAKLKLTTMMSTGGQIEVHKVSASWTETEITWNKKPSWESTLDYSYPQSGSNVEWDITKCVNEWYTTQMNYGVMLKYNNSISGTPVAALNSSEISTQSTRPLVTIGYTNNAGLEDYWTYHSQNVGRAGTVYTNDYNGNVVSVHDDLSMNGNRMPVSIKHVYNTTYKSVDNGFGYGWDLNLRQIVTNQNIGNTNYYIYSDDDGTKHYFSNDGNGYKDKSGLNMTLALNVDGQGTLTIKDKKDNKLVFEMFIGYFRLKYIKDNNNNTLTINYTGTQLTSVTDGANRLTTLNYDAGGKLASIVDPSTRTVATFGYTSNELRTITYADSKSSSYSYYADHKINIATDHTGYKITYSYNPIAPYKVCTLEEANNSGTLGQTTQITYGSNQTKIETQYPSSGKRATTYQFNSYGNTTSIMDNVGNTQYFQYNTDNGPLKNKLKLQSKLQVPIMNKVKNAGCYLLEDTESYYWQQTCWGSSIGETGWGGEAEGLPTYFGIGTYYVTKTNTGGRELLKQNLTLSSSGMSVGKTYNLSAFVKTVGITKNAPVKGASVFVAYNNGISDVILGESNYVNGTTDWQRVDTQFTIPSGVASISIYLSIDGAIGTAYFDNIQVEEGPVSNRFNCIENPDFTYVNSGTSMPYYWGKSTSCDSGDCPTTLTDYPQKLDGKCFKIVGASDQTTGKAKSVYDTISTPAGKKGDVFSVGCWAKAESVPGILTEKEAEISSTDRVFGLVLKFTLNDDSTRTYLIPFNPYSREWQYVCDRIVAPEDYAQISLMGCYYNNANTAYFDGFQLYKEEFGESYLYDGNGNLTKSTSSDNKDTSYTYNSSNDMTSSVNGGGNEVGYEFNNHNLTNVKTPENVVSSNTYDAYGNPENTKVGSGGLFIQSSTSYTPNGNYESVKTDPSGKTMSYNFNTTKGTLSSVTDPKSKITSYSYDSNLDRLTDVYKIVDGAEVRNTYSYKDSSNNETDKLTKITHNGFEYNFNYDGLGNMLSSKVGTQALVTNNYEPRSSKLLDSTFGNNQKISYDYDDLDRVTAKKYNDTQKRYTYYYDSNGNLAYYENRADLKATNPSKYSTQRYIYDLANRPVKTIEKANSQQNITSYSYYDDGNTSAINENINGKSYSTNYLYDRNGSEKQTYYNRYGKNDETVEYFPLNTSTNGSLGNIATSQNTEFENNEEFVPVLAAFEGTTNLLSANTSFENGDTSGWTLDSQGSTGAGRIVRDSVNGNYCLEFYDSDNLNNGSATNIIAYQDYTLTSPLTQNTNFTLSTQVKTIGANGKWPELDIKCFDTAGNPVASYTNPKDITFDGQWIKISQCFSAVTTTKKIRVILKSTVKDSQLVRYDNVQLEQKSFATPYTSSSRQASNVLYNMTPAASTSSGTMGVWFETFGIGTRQIFELNKTNGGNISLYMTSDGHLRVDVKNTLGQMVNVISENTIDVGNNGTYNWYFAALKWSVSGPTLTCTLKIKNGTQLYSVSGSTTNFMNFDNSTTSLGGKSDGSNPFNGRMRALFYSATALSDTDISNIFQTGKGTTINKMYDILGRPVTSTVNTGSNDYVTSYLYLDGAIPQGETIRSSTYRLGTIINNGNACIYTYDENGNIKTITQNGKTITYTYNELNELIREDNQTLTEEWQNGLTYVYTYNIGGNITNKSKYKYTDPLSIPQASDLLHTYSYSYAFNTEWKDKLMTYDGGSTMLYDNIGNLTSDGTRTYTWEEGRNLTSMSWTGNSISYLYNDRGIRTEKTVNSVTTRYHLIGDKVTYEDNGTDKIYYTFDAGDKLVSMNLNGTEYYYIKNGQIDIVGLFDKNGTQVVTYSYDTWGKLISTTGSLASTVGVKNPYRYRGYRYDTESGLYYLQSRYYNPEWGRFINADANIGQQGALLSHNLYAYCNNCPVNLYDPTGEFAFLIPIVVTAPEWVPLVGAAIGTAIAIDSSGNNPFDRVFETERLQTYTIVLPATGEKVKVREERGTGIWFAKVKWDDDGGFEKKFEISKETALMIAAIPGSCNFGIYVSSQVWAVMFAGNNFIDHSDTTRQNIYARPHYHNRAAYNASKVIWPKESKKWSSAHIWFGSEY